MIVKLMPAGFVLIEKKLRLSLSHPQSAANEIETLFAINPHIVGLSHRRRRRCERRKEESSAHIDRPPKKDSLSPSTRAKRDI